MKKKQYEYHQVSCPACTRCYMIVGGIRCEHGGPYKGFLDMDTKELIDIRTTKVVD